MGDKKRFDLFAKAISKRFPSWMRVADIAGGKGYLQLALKEQGFKDVITFDCIVPCCIMPTRLLFWDKRNYRGWVKALTKMAETQNFEVEKYQLRMNGKNLALFGKPK